MPIAISYSFFNVVPKRTVYTGISGGGSNSDTVGFSGGGWATSVTGADGHSSVSFYGPLAGTVTSTNSFGSAGGRLAQLTGGTVVVVGSPASGGVNYAVMTTSAGTQFSGSITAVSSETNADVAALTGGGFVVADQRAFNSPDHDIYIHVRNGAGGAVKDFAVDGSVADDENASVAGLNDGGFAVAFDRRDSSGNTSLWYAVYNADGTTRTAATLLDSFGAVNERANVTALKSGGFAIGYQDSGWDGTLQASVALLDANGAFQSNVQGSSLPSENRNVSLTTLSNGFVMSSFTNAHQVNGKNEFDIRGTLIDPVTKAALTDITNPVAIDTSTDNTNQSSISAVGLAQVAVSYTNATTNAVNVQTLQLVRTVTGTAVADVFTGDDAVNRISGLGGNDSLTGGANDDVINGGTGNDKLYGLGGSDTLNGGLGDDTISGGTGSDMADYSGITAAVTVDLGIRGQQNTGGGGTDTLISIESLTGGSGSDRLTGTVGANVINGGLGDDRITGLYGADTLIGGGGSDTFVYTTLDDSGLTGTTRDQIYDFAASQDKIDLSAIDANATVAGDQAFTFIGTGKFTGVAGQLDLSTSGNNTFVQGDVNGDKVMDFQIQILGLPTLTASNFTL